MSTHNTFHISRMNNEQSDWQRGLEFYKQELQIHTQNFFAERWELFYHHHQNTFLMMSSINMIQHCARLAS